MAKKTLLILGIVFQLCVLIGMIVLKAAPLVTGDVVLLRVVPVDPRNLFRGDYVTLSYDFSRIPEGGIPELGVQHYDRKNEWEGKTVFISLVPEEDGKHWKTKSISTVQPTSGKFIRGTISGWNQITCGIESYFVQEGTGRDFENAARNKKLSAEVAIADDGRAALRKLRIEEPKPNSKPTYDTQEKFRWPTDITYRVRKLPKADIKLDGNLSEPEWSQANAERHFIFPWKKTAAPATEFLAFCDNDYLYFAFRVEDSDLVVSDKLRDKEDAIFEDRVELYFSKDHQMKDYFCLEIDPRGRVLDYRGSYYRQIDMKWHCEGVEAAGETKDNGYAVEGRIPLASLREFGLSQFNPGEKILCGIFRAEFSHDCSGKPVEQQKETIHNRGRKPEGPPPIEEWISWIDPKTPEPDFHVPSSLGWLEIVE